MSNVYSARTLWLEYTKEQMWALEDGPIKLQFDDEEIIETNVRETIFSWYLGTYHRLYPNTPLLSKHHLNGRFLKKSTHTEILGLALFDCYRAYGETMDLEELSKIAFETTNLIYNEFTERLKPHVSTLSMYDLEEALNHPEVKEANEWIHSVVPTSGNITKTHNRIEETITRKGTLQGNAFSRMAKSRLVKIGQTLQILGPRGNVTEIDSHLFQTPILNGYGHGLYKLHDFLIETRSAAKSLIFATDYVADSEYFGRELQLSTSIISRLHPGDCGSQRYAKWILKSKDLPMFNGKHYLDKETGTLKTITRNSTELVGKPIHVRTPLECEHRDTYGICSTCFGNLSMSIPNQTNIGHVCATILCEKTSQMILSTKHYEGSSEVGGIETLSERQALFLRLGPEGSNSIMLSSALKGYKVMLMVQEKEAQNLAQVDFVGDMSTVSLTQISELSEVVIEAYNKDDILMDREILPVSHGSRLSSFTEEALSYIKEHNYRPVDGRYYVIDLSEWDFELPIFQLPMKHPDMVETMKTIKKFILSNDKTKKGGGFHKLIDFPTATRGLQELHNIVSSKLDVNIAHLEVIVLATLAQNIAEGNHAPPVPKYSGEVSSYNENMRIRSLGTGMAYQGQYKLLTNFESFDKSRVRPDSMYDNLLCPFPHVNPRE